MQPTNGIQALVLEYLKAFDARDLDRCLSFCTADATFHFLWRSFRGRKEIEKWHHDGAMAHRRWDHK
jgi:ketosteroid isomerase-like protein